MPVALAIAKNLASPLSKNLASPNVETLATQVFDFTGASAPDGFTAVRSGTTATYIDSSGKWQQAAANTLRLHNDQTLGYQGVLVENTLTNKANHANFEPTTIGDIAVVSGDGSASVTADATKLASAEIDGGTIGDLSNDNVIAMTGGTAGTFYRVSVDSGNTNTHAFRVVVRTGATGYHGYVRQSDGDGQTTFTQDTEYHEIVSNDLTPNATSRYLTVLVTAGKTVYMVGAQYVEYSRPTSPIITTGTGGQSRNRDEIKHTSVTEFVDREKGSVIFEGNVFDVGDSEQGLFGFVDDNGASDMVSARSLSGDGFIDFHIFSANSDGWSEKVGKPLEDAAYITGVVYNSDRALGFHSHGVTTVTDTSITVPAADLNELFIGRWKRYFGYANGVLCKKLTVIQGNTTLKNTVSKFRDDIGAVMVNAGQSNIAYEQKHQGSTTYTNGGEVSAIEQLDLYYTDGRNGVCNTAISGSRIYNQSVGNDIYWLEDDLSDGILLTRALEMIEAIGADKIICWTWNQGESNTGQTKAYVKTGWQKIIDRFRTVLPSCPFFLEPKGRRTDGDSGNADYEQQQEIFEELIAENSDIYLLPNTKVLPMYDETGVSDGVHISDAGMQEKAKWRARYIASLDGKTVSGAVTGSSISSVSRSGTSVTVTLTHPTGISDFTPTTGIEGFVFEDDGSEITISSAVRTNATTITLTLASTPSGAEVLKYCYGSGYGLDRTNLVRGNDTLQMPLQVYKGTVS